MKSLLVAVTKQSLHRRTIAVIPAALAVFFGIATPVAAGPLLYGPPTGFAIGVEETSPPGSPPPPTSIWQVNRIGINSLYGAFVSGFTEGGYSCIGYNLSGDCFFSAANNDPDPPFPTQPTLTTPAPGNVVASYYAVSANSSAAAAVDLGTGDLAVTSQNNGTPQAGAGALAFLWDTITFTGASPGAQVTVHMSGSSISTGNARVDGSIGFSPGLPSVIFGSSGGVNLGNCDGYSFLPTNGSYDLSFTGTIQNNVQYTFAACMSDITGFDPSNGAGSEFTTDPISFDLPDGVTFTSASGILLNGDTHAVPEPMTLSLFFGGLTGMVVMRRRKAKQG
jgi:hypothetical protein